MNMNMKYQKILPCPSLAKHSFGQWTLQRTFVWQVFSKHQIRSRPPCLSMTEPTCRLCGDAGHRAMQCPYLVSDDEMIMPEDAVSQVSSAMGSEMRARKTPQRTSRDMEAFQARVIAEAKAKYPPRPSSRAAEGWLHLGTSQPQMFDLAGDEDFKPTEEEVKMLVKKREKKAATQAKNRDRKALTGQLADYPSLSHCWSAEVCLNVVGSARARMVTFLWKKLLWQLRVKEAVERTYQRAVWRRNPRWLAMLMGKEVAALWGHLGALRQKLWNPEVLALM